MCQDRLGTHVGNAGKRAFSAGGLGPDHVAQGDGAAAGGIEQEQEEEQEEEGEQGQEETQLGW